MLKRRIISVTLVATSLMLAVPAWAWSEAGHRIIAVIAFEQMKPETRISVLKILEKHPRFQDDFDLPDDLAPGKKNQQRWLFSQMAHWPDKMRDVPEFHRQKWHFYNQPLFLSDAEKAVLEGQLS